MEMVHIHGLIKGELLMKDISKLFEKAINMADSFNLQIISKDIEKLSNIWCRVEDDSTRNWYTISLTDGKTVVEDYGYLSYNFPIALLKENCPKYICDVINKHNVLYVQLCDRFSCEPKILEKYIDTQEIIFIDDCFMEDDNIPFDEDAFLKIDEGANYINPYKFSFLDIK